MLRLTLLLCIGLYAALMTLGDDHGQLRPGLAKAVAEGRLGEGSYGAFDEAVPEPEPVQLAKATPEPPPEPEPKPQALPEPLPEPLFAAEPILPDPAAPPVVVALEDPVFSLASLGNEPVPGEDGTALREPEPLPAGAENPIWYVTATSVNVRAAPSTEAEILDKLALGEATLLLEQVDAEWARITIQGDGLEGYVALRYLSPEAP